MYLTDDVARQLPSPATGQKLHWDSDDEGRPGSATRGLALRVTSGGAKSWVYTYRAKDTGTQRRYKIGRFPVVKAEAARKKAEALAEKIEMGADPQATRSDERKAIIKVDKLIEDFLDKHVSTLRSSTQAGYRAILRAHVAPAIGRARARCRGRRRAGHTPKAEQGWEAASGEPRRRRRFDDVCEGAGVEAAARR
jgi:Arm DNA-binding domain